MTSKCQKLFYLLKTQKSSTLNLMSKVTNVKFLITDFHKSEILTKNYIK